jgi:hypothetical protein
MNFSKHLFIIFICSFVLNITPSNAALMTMHPAKTGLWHQENAKNQLSELSRSKRKGRADDGKKEGIYAIVSAVVAIICAYLIYNATGEGAIITYLWAGILGIACLGAALIGLIIFLIKRKRAQERKR